MKLKTAFLAVALATTLALPASAQTFTTGTYGGGHFHSFTTGGGGFGGGFMQSFLAGRRVRAAMEEARAAQMAAEQNSPLGHCISIRTDALFRQKKAPTAAQVQAAKAECEQANR